MKRNVLYLSLGFHFRGITALSVRNSFRRTSLKLEDVTVSRRETLSRTMTAVFVGAATSQSFITPSIAMYENAPATESGPVTLQSGVTFQDIRQGDGELVEEGKRVNIQWVLKRSNGYTIDSSSTNDGIPFIFIVGGYDRKETRAIVGLDLGIRGMRVGGIRRIVMPPSLAYVDGVEDGKPGPVPKGFGPKQRIRRVMELLKDVPGESIILDVKATRVQ